MIFQVWINFIFFLFYFGTLKSYKNWSKFFWLTLEINVRIDGSNIHTYLLDRILNILFWINFSTYDWASLHCFDSLYWPKRRWVGKCHGFGRSGALTLFLSPNLRLVFVGCA